MGLMASEKAIIVWSMPNINSNNIVACQNCKEGLKSLQQCRSTKSVMTLQQGCNKDATIIWQGCNNDVTTVTQLFQSCYTLIADFTTLFCLRYRLTRYIKVAVSSLRNGCILGPTRISISIIHISLTFSLSLHLFLISDRVTTLIYAGTWFFLQVFY